jgi:hypothetical protein
VLAGTHYPGKTGLRRECILVLYIASVTSDKYLYNFENCFLFLYFAFMKTCKIILSTLQRAILEKITKEKTVSSRDKERSFIILGLSSGVSSLKLSKQLTLNRHTVRRCHLHWNSHQSSLLAIEAKSISEKSLPYCANQCYLPCLMPLVVVAQANLVLNSIVRCWVWHWKILRIVVMKLRIGV